MKTKVNAQIFQHGSFVYGKILFTDEGLRGKESLMWADVSGRSKKWYYISSSTYPGIDHDTLFLWGRCERRDNIIISYKFPTIEDANEWIINIKYLLNKINKCPYYKFKNLPGGSHRII